VTVLRRGRGNEIKRIKQPEWATVILKGGTSQKSPPTRTESKAMGEGRTEAHKMLGKEETTRKVGDTLTGSSGMGSGEGRQAV
jgi:hypothetical protein